MKSATLRQRLSFLTPLLGPIVLGLSLVGMTIVLALRARLLLWTVSADAVSIVEVRSLVVTVLLLIAILASLLVLVYVFLQRRSRVLEVQKIVESEKSSFVRMAADTIRTPLTGLRWLTELLLHEDLGNINPQQRESIDNMNVAIHRLISLVNELLNVMRLSGEIIHYRPQLCDVNDVLTQTIGDLQSIAAAKLVVLAYGKLSKDADVILDLPLVRHMLGTLLGNAIHVTPIGGKIVLHAEAKTGEMLIGVTYTGNAILFKPLDDGEGQSMIVVNSSEDSSLDFTISWEILQAAHGRFWVRDGGVEHTLFVSFPREST
ncbi:HAMP domain-containing histidine kinase [Candidatus Peregrinibacteria bacterium]|nr:HAMP domain-containing histidine kinase [Candidatus Peregrinibacteria bacterium]